jgi:hypothetical protein
MSADGALGRPEHGARIVVRLAPDGALDATYEVVLASPERAWTTSATVKESDGQVELLACSTEPGPPSWLTQAAHALLRSAWQRRRAGHVWPRRLARWRPAPDGAADA